MKIPEPLFVLLNKVVRLLLKSPLHFLMSKSLLLINHSGRKSGRMYATPVRYMRTGSGIRCFTSEHVQWWRNVKSRPEVTLLIEGSVCSYKGVVLDRDPKLMQPLLVEFLALYPQDAVYQDIRLNSDESLNAEDLAASLQKAIVVEFEEA